MKKNLTMKKEPTDGPTDPPDVKRGRAELARDLAILVRRRLRRDRQRAAVDATRPDAAGAEPGRVA